MKLHWESISTPMKEIFTHINKHKGFNDFYLVGGTALSLLSGHRKSVDLDFFSPREFYPTLISDLGFEYKVNLQSKNTVDIEVNGVKVFFMYFAFPRYKDLIKIDEFRLADPVDIGLMKLLALQGRLTIKDIIDLHFIDKEYIKIEELLTIFDNHFSSEKLNKLENFSNLFDEDLLNQPMPLMIKIFNLEESLRDLRSKVVNHYRLLHLSGS